jgi:IS1 family transposase
VWLLYAYHRATGEIVVFVWGKRDLKTAGKLKKKLSDWEGVTYCLLKHHIFRAFRKTCCFSKKLFNYFKAFNLVFFLHQFRLCLMQHTLHHHPCDNAEQGGLRQVQFRS